MTFFCSSASSHVQSCASSSRRANFSLTCISECVGSGTCGGASCAVQAGGMDCCADVIDEKALPCGAPPCLTADPHLASEVVAGPLAGASVGPMASGTQGQNQNASDSQSVEAAGQNVSDSQSVEAAGQGESEETGATDNAGEGGSSIVGEESANGVVESSSESGTVSEQGTRDRSGAASEDSDMRLASRVNACADAGGVADPFGTQCCPLSCGTCGGQNCSSRPGGAEACCGDQLGSAAVECGSPPCILESEDPDTISARVSACSIAGGISDATGLRCCSRACGACGGKRSFADGISFLNSLLCEAI